MIDMRAISDRDVQSRELAWRRYFDKEAILEIALKSAVVRVQSERTADLVHGDRKQVNALHRRRLVLDNDEFELDLEIGQRCLRCGQ